jgi:hypothetical protein
VRRVGEERQPSFSSRKSIKRSLCGIVHGGRTRRGLERDVDAVERADDLTSRLRLDSGA